MFIEVLSKIEELNENNKIKFEIQKIIEVIKNPRKDNLRLLNISTNGDTAKVNKEIPLEDLGQIAEAQTIERAKYYINRLKKSLTEIKTSKINDLKP
jgi:ribosomal protein S8E